MSVEEHKAIARRFADILNHGQMERRDEVMAPRFRQAHGRLRAAFSDYHATNEDLIAEGDKVAARWTVQATHSGEFKGMAPTGKRVTITGITMVRIVEGKIAD